MGSCSSLVNTVCSNWQCFSRISDRNLSHHLQPNPYWRCQVLNLGPSASQANDLLRSMDPLTRWLTDLLTVHTVGCWVPSRWTDLWSRGRKLELLLGCVRMCIQATLLFTLFCNAWKEMRQTGSDSLGKLVPHIRLANRTQVKLLCIQTILDMARKSIHPFIFVFVISVSTE